MCAPTNWKDNMNMTKVSLCLMDDFGSYKKLTAFNLFLQYGLPPSKSNTADVVLAFPHCKLRDSCFVIVLCDMTFAFHSKVDGNIDVGFSRLQLKDMKGFNLSFCKECKVIKHPCPLHEHLIKMHKSEMSFFEIILNLLHEKKANSKFIFNNCSERTSSLCRKILILKELRKLTFLLKRKCRLMSSALGLHGLEMHRRKRESHIRKLPGLNVNPQSDTTAAATGIRPKREGIKPKHTLHHTTIGYERVGNVWVPKFNETAYRIFAADEKLKQTLRDESEWAYLCLVFLLVLILLSIWCLRGFHSRNTDKRLVTYYDRDHYLTVKEVLYKKARYLPMFNHEGPLEEVFIHDCGTNTETSRFDMIQ